MYDRKLIQCLNLSLFTDSSFGEISMLISFLNIMHTTAILDVSSSHPVQTFFVNTNIKIKWNDVICKHRLCTCLYFLAKCIKKSLNGCKINLKHYISLNSRFFWGCFFFGITRLFKIKVFSLKLKPEINQSICELFFSCF